MSGFDFIAYLPSFILYDLHLSWLQTQQMFVRVSNRSNESEKNRKRWKAKSVDL